MSVSTSSPDLRLRPKKFKRLNREEDTDANVRSLAANSAKELQSKLDPKFPSLIKSLLNSHVSGGYWMGLPALFCQKHLPQVDTLITLETQSKKSYKAKYLIRKKGLSGGWREFAISEKLLVGDVLVFHLLSATKFKVYIVKKNSVAGAKRTLYILNLDSPGEQSNLDMFPICSKDIHFVESDQRTMQPPNNSENNIRSEDLIFNGVSTYDDFNSVINDLLKDYELPQRIKLSYYKLCCSQNGLLHAHLPKPMNNIFVGGTIIATVTIANSLGECELSTSKDEFAIWDKTLNALELLGMNVGFLRARLRCLRSIVNDSEVHTFRTKCAELCSKNARAKDKIRRLAAILAVLKKAHNNCTADISNVKRKMENHELKFKEQVNASW